MPISPFARHHYDQGNAAIRDGDTQGAENAIRAIAQSGTPEDVQDLITGITDAVRKQLDN